MSERSIRTRACLSWRLRLQTSGIYRVSAIPCGQTEIKTGGSAAAAASRPGLAPKSALRIAVGMTIADHPPHRSVLAELPHTAPPLDTSVEALIGIGMKSTRTRNPSIKDRPQLFPVGLPPLTATT